MLRQIQSATMFVVVIAATLFGETSRAQTTVKEKGSYLNVGMGFPYSYGWAYQSSFILQVSGQYGFKQVGPGVFSIGGLTGLAFWSHTNNDGGRGTALGIPLVARLRYHYDWGVKNLDTYAGVSIGLGIHTRGQAVYPLGGLHIGAQYYFTEKIGVFGDLGWDVSAIALGVAIKLN